MRRLADTLRCDEGMSLIELVVASVIGVMVLTVAYLVFETGMKGFRQVENQTMASRTAAQAMLVMDRPIREATSFTVLSGSQLRFRSDINDDGVLELVTFTNPAGSTNLMISKVATSTATTTTVINDLGNAAAGVPLFSYYRDVNVPLGTLNADETTATATKIIRVTVVTQPTNQGATPPSYKVETDIYLRNK